MNKSCVVFESSLVSPHTETAIEIAILEDKAGAEVYYAPLYNHLTRVETWLGNNDKIYNSRVKLYHERITQIIGKHARVIEFAKVLPPEIPITASSNLINIYLEEFPIGASIHSTLTFLTKSSEICLDNDTILENAQLLYVIGYQAYMLSVAILKKLKPSMVYICNGRFTTQAANKYACLKLNIDYLLHERGPNKDAFTLQKEIHDLKWLNEFIPRFASKFDKKVRELSASAFFDSVYSRKKANWGNFTAFQEYNYIPDHLKNISFVTYYVSSDDEFDTLTFNDLDVGFGKQRQAFQTLKKNMRKEKGPSGG